VTGFSCLFDPYRLFVFGLPIIKLFSDWTFRDLRGNGHFCKPSACTYHSQDRSFSSAAARRRCPFRPFDGDGLAQQLEEQARVTYYSESDSTRRLKLHVRGPAFSRRCQNSCGRDQSLSGFMMALARPTPEKRPTQYFAGPSTIAADRSLPRLTYKPPTYKLSLHLFDGVVDLVDQDIEPGTPHWAPWRISALISSSTDASRAARGVLRPSYWAKPCCNTHPPEDLAATQLALANPAWIDLFLSRGSFITGEGNDRVRFVYAVIALPICMAGASRWALDGHGVGMRNWISARSLPRALFIRSRHVLDSNSICSASKQREARSRVSECDPSHLISWRESGSRD